MNNIVVIFAIAGIFIAFMSYHIVHIMTCSEEYTERNDFGYWSKTCKETGELNYLRKKTVKDFVNNIACEFVLLIISII